MANLQSFERTDYQQVKADLHRKILDRLDLEKLGKAAGDSARDEVLVVIRSCRQRRSRSSQLCRTRAPLARNSRRDFRSRALWSNCSKIHNISDILVNRYDRVYVGKAPASSS